MTSPPVPSGGIGSTAWQHLLSSGADAMGIYITDVQMERLGRFAEMLCEWNKRINLTAITDPEEMALKHFLDSLAALPHLPEAGRLLDIGSGGGFPGLVLAIFLPSLEITSIDSVRKKISFQQHLIRTLGLKGACALHTRAEWLQGEETNRYDVIVSRALGSLSMFVTLALPMLAEKGRIIAYKGVINDSENDEIDALTSKHPDLSVEFHTYCLPRSGDRRSLVFVRKR